MLPTWVVNIRSVLVCILCSPFEYRQILSDPYRLIYRVIEDQVIVYLIADGRRVMQSLLARRSF
jgi:hypothetical protein